MKIELFYDKECPFCNSYANYIKIKEDHELILNNARDFKDDIELLRSKGFDINNGFIVKVDDTDIYQGVDAIVFLNKLAKKAIYFPDNLFFRNIIYPLIKTIRKILLYLLGKKPDIE